VDDVATESNALPVSNDDVITGSTRSLFDPSISATDQQHQINNRVHFFLCDASNNARWMQSRKTTHGQHQDMDRTPRVLLCNIYFVFDMDSECKFSKNRVLEESIRMKKDTDKWRKYVHGLSNPQIKDS